MYFWLKLSLFWGLSFIFGVLVVKRLMQFSRSQHQFFANFYLNGGGTTRGIKGILLKIAEKVQGSGLGGLGKCS